VERCDFARYARLGVAFVLVSISDMDRGVAYRTERVSYCKGRIGEIVPSALCSSAIRIPVTESPVLLLKENDFTDDRLFPGVYEVLTSAAIVNSCESWAPATRKDRHTCSDYICFRREIGRKIVWERTPKHAHGSCDLLD
jgi:hypothetical protein